jgi:hypothetical protein
MSAAQTPLKVDVSKEKTTYDLGMKRNTTPSR